MRILALEMPAYIVIILLLNVPLCVNIIVSSFATCLDLTLTPSVRIKEAHDVSTATKEPKTHATAEILFHGDQVGFDAILAQKAAIVVEAASHNLVED